METSPQSSKHMKSFILNRLHALNAVFRRLGEAVIKWLDVALQKMG